MIKNHQWVFLIILVFAIAVRFWSFSQRIGIGYDGSRDAIVAFESARQWQLPLTGSFSSIGPIPFGPWYYWYLTLAVLTVPSSFAPWIAVAAASVAMVIIMYLIGSRLVSRQFGLVVALLGAISPAQILASTQLQQHALIGFLSSLALFLCLFLTGKSVKSLSAVWGFVHGVAILVHYQSAGLLALPFFFFLLYKKWSLLLPFISGIFLSAVPTLIFETTNHWFTVRNILDYVFIAQYRVWTSNRWLTFAGVFFPDFWSYVVGLPRWLTASAMVTGIFIVGRAAVRRRADKRWILILCTFLTITVMLRYYRGEKYFGYLQFFHPYVLLFTAWILYRLMMRLRYSWYRIAVLTGILIIILPHSYTSMRADEFNQKTSSRFQTITAVYPDAQFAVYKCNDIYDTNNAQGLLLMLMMKKRYALDGRRVSVLNPNCPIPQRMHISNELADVNDMKSEDLTAAGLEPITPQIVWADTARWWFKEQP